ncbi:trypsin-like peptidase domain-containing protein [Patescibacteria group bacterium]|nr:trypsin-like peptidase domain-containing protein [Patescibacteria group bacterium]MCL5797542.1 trypsin-like peptidase domain-containing protein [Patescibacteria group bacterium]
MKRIILLVLLIIVLLAYGAANGQWQLQLSKLGQLLPQNSSNSQPAEKIKIVSEESVVTDVVDKVSPSVVTVSIVTTQGSSGLYDLNPFDPFGFFGDQQLPPSGGSQGQSQQQQQDIGSGFIVDQDGMIVTNKHVVSDTTAKYKVITKDDKTYEVQNIYRDPANDLAILKINASGLKPVAMGDSSKLKVGQMAIAIGTALGEFRNTVTTGVISGLGRGITAGSPYEGYVERLDNVIQTDAAINPGNSGGPLLNSSGQVIGINTAVSQSGQNIGFAIPIDVIKDALDQFNKSGGKFQRPFLGVRYKMITRDLALLNDVPEGAYVENVVVGSPADTAGLQKGDIITKVDGKRLRSSDNNDLATIISGKKVGDSLSVEVWRNNNTKTFNVILGSNDGSQQ